ncbi:MAG: ADP-ribosylglycohydrolase family protein [Leptolyngbya sp. DLM2.Bin15]|nr:MAG: ADP-ribosylglycohydrolase family protein [Leptolyngbya sp. DLM2.Bin15]
MVDRESPVMAGLLGVCVADALGVPVEFTSRDERRQDPVTDMRGYGTWNQPPGTWSDDSSLMLCLAESLCTGFDTEDIGDRFRRWYTEAYWTPHGDVFDIGGTTQQAIAQLQRGIPAVEAGGKGESNNGNGSLMRILPMAFCASRWELAQVIQQTHAVSCITHAHPRSQIACGLYISIAVRLLQGDDLATAYQTGLQQVTSFYQSPPFVAEWPAFARITTGQIDQLPDDAITSGGYVVHTLEASLWCVLTTQSYRDAVLKAVNLGGDTDTTAAVTGGLAGLAYGLAGLPREWLGAIARYDDIVNLAQRLEQTWPMGA